MFNYQLITDQELDDWYNDDLNRDEYTMKIIDLEFADVVSDDDQ